MRYDLKERVRDYVLDKKEVGTSELVQHFMAKSYTKQGVYKCLNNLLEEGVIVWKSSIVAINLIYAKKEIDKLTSLFNKKEILLKPAQGATHKMSSLKELDDIYAQVFIQIVEGLKRGESYSFLFYDIHNYTYINKQGTVDWYIEYLKKLGKVYLLVGSRSELDMSATKSMKGASVYNIDKKWNYYVSVLGEYVIYNYIDKKILNKISLIMNYKNKPEAERGLKELELSKGSFKIVVKKDREEAEKINKFFKKYFILKA